MDHIGGWGGALETSWSMTGLDLQWFPYLFLSNKIMMFWVWRWETPANPRWRLRINKMIHIFKTANLLIIFKMNFGIEFVVFLTNPLLMKPCFSANWLATYKPPLISTAQLLENTFSSHKPSPRRLPRTMNTWKQYLDTSLQDIGLTIFK